MKCSRISLNGIAIVGHNLQLLQIFAFFGIIAKDRMNAAKMSVNWTRRHFFTRIA